MDGLLMIQGCLVGVKEVYDVLYRKCHSQKLKPYYT
jgi:hypothetical protein